VRRWPWELLLLACGYEVYRATRIAVTGSRSTALAHAGQVVRLEKAFGLYWEGRVHRAIRHHPWALHACDLYYGTVHFVVPAAALLVLFRWRPERYLRWRNVFGWMLAIGLVGFAAWPLLPPHLLPPSLQFGNVPSPVPPRGNPFAWAADNPYAAMPSLHVGWSTWCTLALLPVVRNRLGRAALFAYPVVTLFVVVATANHYVLDAVGGWLTLGAAYGLEVVRSRTVGAARGQRSGTVVATAPSSSSSQSRPPKSSRYRPRSWSTRISRHWQWGQRTTVPGACR
jgi:hypothetical protein